MPTYNFKCSNCNSEFDVILKMKDSDGKQLECPVCHTVGKCIQQIGVSKIVSGHHTNHRIPDGFKDLLKGIKKSYPRNKIDVV
jgi:putative FmdB family regulatory protein